MEIVLVVVLALLLGASMIPDAVRAYAGHRWLEAVGLSLFLVAFAGVLLAVVSAIPGWAGWGFVALTIVSFVLLSVDTHRSRAVRRVAHKASHELGRSTVPRADAELLARIHAAQEGPQRVIDLTK